MNPYSLVWVSLVWGYLCAFGLEGGLCRSRNKIGFSVWYESPLALSLFDFLVWFDKGWFGMVGLS